MTRLLFCFNHTVYKFRILIDTVEYKYMRDILLPKGMCSESRDLFKFWEISDISKMLKIET